MTRDAFVVLVGQPPVANDLQLPGLLGLACVAVVGYAGVMRYPDGGGLTAVDRARREQVRLEAAERRALLHRPRHRVPRQPQPGRDRPDIHARTAVEIPDLRPVVHCDHPSDLDWVADFRRAHLVASVNASHAGESGMPSASQRRIWPAA